MKLNHHLGEISGLPQGTKYSIFQNYFTQFTGNKLKNTSSLKLFSIFGLTESNLALKTYNPSDGLGISYSENKGINYFDGLGINYSEDKAIDCFDGLEINSSVDKGINNTNSVGINDSKDLEMKGTPGQEDHKEICKTGDQYGLGSSNGKEINRNSEVNLRNSISDGKPKNISSDGKTKTDISNGKTRTGISDGKPKTCISDGKPKTCISDGKPKTCISDGKPKNGRSDGKVRSVSSDGKARNDESSACNTFIFNQLIFTRKSSIGTTDGKSDDKSIQVISPTRHLINPTYPSYPNKQSSSPLSKRNSFI